MDSQYHSVPGGTKIILPDGRTGTITYHNLDGMGGIWGEHDFSHLPQNFDDRWPTPEFMLRDKIEKNRETGKKYDTEELLRSPRMGHRQDIECVGTYFEKYEPNP